MSVRNRIVEFLSSLGKDHKTFPYLYNARRSSFDPKKDWVYYSGPFWDLAEPTAALEAFITGKWLSSGEYVHRFEKEFSRRFNFQASLMVNSGSSANLAMMSALKKHHKWQDNDEIIVSAVGFPTTTAPILQNNLRPVFIDINIDDLNFDLDLIESRITSRTRAIFISPVLGNTPDMDRLLVMAEKHSVMLVLDGCDSLGSKWRGKHLSDFAYSTSCSFYPAHHITTGEGGMVSSNDEAFVATARSFAWWGRDCYCVGSANLLPRGTCANRFSNWLERYDGVIDHKFVFMNVGYNLKPLDLQGAIGLEQLKKVDEAHHLRRKNKDIIAAAFTNSVKGVRVPGELPDAETGWFGVPVICEQNSLKVALVSHLEKNRIQTRNYFAGNILLHPAYAHLDDYKKYPVSNRVLDQVFFVGCHPSYDEDVLGYIEKVLKEFKPD